MAFELFPCRGIWILRQEVLVKYLLCDQHMLKGRRGNSYDMVFILRASSDIRSQQVPVLPRQRVCQEAQHWKPQGFPTVSGKTTATLAPLIFQYQSQSPQ